MPPDSGQRHVYDRWVPQHHAGTQHGGRQYPAASCAGEPQLRGLRGGVDLIPYTIVSPPPLVAAGWFNRLPSGGVAPGLRPGGVGAWPEAGPWPASLAPPSVVVPPLTTRCAPGGMAGVVVTLPSAAAG